MQKTDMLPTLIRVIPSISQWCRSPAKPLPSLDGDGFVGIDGSDRFIIDESNDLEMIYRAWYLDFYTCHWLPSFTIVTTSMNKRDLSHRVGSDGSRLFTLHSLIVKWNLCFYTRRLSGLCPPMPILTMSV